MLLAVSAASVSAQTYQIRKDSVKTGEYSPTVYLVSVNAPQPPADEEALLEAAVLNQLAIDNAIRDYIETHHPGFQQDELPHFIFATKQNKFSFSLGGQVTLRASYDFDGISGAQDFIPATIAVPGTYATRQKFGLDGTTSRIFLKAIANSKKLGRVTLYFSTDFRGGGTNSYTPRIRSAYVSFKGFTFGRDVTTFCDLNAAPNTIDFQGPNAYNYFFSTMIRYEHSIYRDILKFGVAAELPNVSGTYGDSFASIPQRVPDFPVYMQVNWGRNKESHFRASAVFRDMYLHNESTGNNTSLFGWGVQASGNIKVAGPLQLFFNGVYGEGITPYIQDLSGIGLDFTPNPHNPRSIQTMPMYGWQAAAQIDLVPNKLAISGGYSMAEVCRRNGAYADDEYRRGQYVFGNIFWDLASAFCSDPANRMRLNYLLTNAALKRLKTRVCVSMCAIIWSPFCSSYLTWKPHFWFLGQSLLKTCQRLKRRCMALLSCWCFWPNWFWVTSIFGKKARLIGNNSTQAFLFFK